MLVAVWAVAAAPAASPAVWLDVPFVPQEKHGCGAAAVAMLVQYWSRQSSAIAATDPRAIQKALYSEDVRGIRGADLQRYLRANGFRTFAFKAEWSDLNGHLTKGRPLVVCLDLSRGGPWHYVVVAGVDPEASLVLVNDPARRKLLKMHRAEFERAWNIAGNWTLLAVPLSAP